MLYIVNCNISLREKISWLFKNKEFSLSFLFSYNSGILHIYINCRRIVLRWDVDFLVVHILCCFTCPQPSTSWMDSVCVAHRVDTWETNMMSVREIEREYEQVTRMGFIHANIFRLHIWYYHKLSSGYWQCFTTFSAKETFIIFGRHFQKQLYITLFWKQKNHHCHIFFII